MTSSSEKTFGARYQNAQTILTYIQSLTDYDPPQATETIAQFQKFLLSIVEINSLNSESEQLYGAAVKARQKAFRDGPQSLTKLLPSLRGAVDAAYGKNSQQAKAISSLIKKMRSPGLHKSATPLKPSEPTPSAEDTKIHQPVSQSQLSFGSVTQCFQDLITTLTQLDTYVPSNPNLQIASLEVFATSLNNSNNKVAEEYGKLSAKRKIRQELYVELRERVQRIKAYLKAQYGMDSKIYELVKGLSV